MLYFSKRPSSIKTMHLPHVAFSAQIDSISTPKSCAAERMDWPSATCPRLPEGCRMMLCFFVIGLTIDDGRLTMAYGLSSMVVIGERCPDEESQFLQTQFPVQREAYPQFLRVRPRVLSMLRVYIVQHTLMPPLIPQPSHKRQSHFGFSV